MKAKILEVAAGGRALITPEHLSVVVDYAKLGLLESHILFHVVEFPLHGSLDVSVWDRPGDTIFTLLDLNTDKIAYVNSAADSFTSDTVVFDVELSSSGLPKQRVLLHVNIVARNDVPKISLTSNNPMRLAKGTRKQLPAHLIKIEDDDNGPKELLLTVVSKDDQGGFLENERFPGRPAEQFTLEELNSGHVYYVDRGKVSESQIGLRVSDGRDDGNVITVRIQTIRLRVVEVNNTGLSLAAGSSAVITPFNLTFTTNATDQVVNIR